MKILLCLLLAVGALAAQVVVLDEGWKRISEGKEMDPGPTDARFFQFNVKKGKAR